MKKKANKRYYHMRKDAKNIYLYTFFKNENEKKESNAKRKYHKSSENKI